MPDGGIELARHQSAFCQSAGANRVDFLRRPRSMCLAPFGAGCVCQRRVTIKAARRRYQPPTRLGATMTDHRHPPSSVSNDVHVNNFECMEALHALRLEVVQLEALTNAASEAVTQLPFPSDREERRIFDRVYALVTKVADETTALVAYGDELVAELENPTETSSATDQGSEG